MREETKVVDADVAGVEEEVEEGVEDDFYKIKNTYEVRTLVDFFPGKNTERIAYDTFLMCGWCTSHKILYMMYSSYFVRSRIFFMFFTIYNHPYDYLKNHI